MSRGGRRLAVIGGGFVGLNVAVHAALRGYRVVVVDLDEGVVESINSGDAGLLRVREPYVSGNWDRVRSRIYATSDYSEAAGLDYYVVAVNTPLRVYGRRLAEAVSAGAPMEELIDFSPLERAGASLGEVVGEGAVVLSESTIYPGGTLERLGRPLEASSGLLAGEGFLLAHSPERIFPGSGEWDISSTPRVVGGVNEASLREALRFYGEGLGLAVHPVGDIGSAELSKLYENAHRLVAIAFASSLSALSPRGGADFHEALEAAHTKPFGLLRVRPGYVGGPCLLKDAVMLYAWMASRGARRAYASILRDAIVVNELYVEHLADSIAERAGGRRRILFLGLGYKPGSPYYVSPGLNPVARVMEALRSRGYEAKGYDPAIPWASDFGSMREALEWAELSVGWGYKGDVDLEKL